ncbi:hypothetical protein ADEAN_000515000 [Angomonas deanei]|uniref:Uncharacterized protein n=1 Tax=Angomonas deanei TaxID=59799 RepID=A0A7G2CCX2_9TRYP|nr:hypothetical protein ADEAN_000515000 [Angomonas deanei]
MEEDNFSLITDVLVTSTVLLLGTPGGLLLYAPSTGRNPPPMLLLGKRRVPGGVGRLSSFQDGSLIVAQSYQEKNTVLVLDLSASTTPHPDEEDFSVLVLAKKTFKSEILAVNFSEDCMVVITAPIPHHNNDENNNLKSSTHARVHIFANSNDYPHRLERLFWFHCYDKGESSSLQDLLVFPSSYDVLFSRDDRDNMVSHKCSRVVFPAEKKDTFTVMTMMSEYPHSPTSNQKKNPTSFSFQSSPPYPASSTGESLSLRCMQLNALGNKVITIDREEGKNIHLWAVVHHAPQDSIVYVGALTRGQTHAAQDCVSLSITSMPLSYPRENQNNINNNNSNSVFYPHGGIP